MIDPVSQSPPPRHVAVTGSSGFIGGALVEALRAAGDRVSRLVRHQPDPSRGEILWDPDTGRVDAAALEGVDAVVHLAGEPIGERWSADKKRRIRDSRVRGTRLLAEALASLSRPPEVLVSTSAIGIYGQRGSERLDEQSRPGSDFLAEVGQEWEAAAEPAALAGVRVVHPRMGLVLHPSGGALARMLPVFRLGGGGRLGGGQQWWSWIARPDAVDALRFLITTTGMRGPVNLVAPEPVTNREFTEALGQALHRPALFPVPAAALHLLFGEMADATLLASQRVAPDRLLGDGFVFRFPRLDTALRALLDRA